MMTTSPHYPGLSYLEHLLAAPHGHEPLSF